MVHQAVDHAEDGEAAADDGEDVDDEAEEALALLGDDDLRR